ncbi:MAG: type II toxin-antitoxin system CcdA family antitoxin [Wenzhouxiangellaceae bacterium]
MPPLYDTDAPKQTISLSINTDLLTKSRQLKINLSATFEAALEQLIAENAAVNWASENKNAVNAYNEFVEEHGLFSDEFRKF